MDSPYFHGAPTRVVNHTPQFTDTTFLDATKSMKFAKVFTLENFYDYASILSIDDS